MAVHLPQREYRTWTVDSRWVDYRPRPDDVVIATYDKCGTTWVQQIVALLIFQDTTPRPVMDISVWVDRRFGQPIEAVWARLETQTHRRFLKAHLPADGLPLHDGVRYIHVARDGRDAALSFHNHHMSFSPAGLDALDRAGLADPTIGRPYPRALPDPADQFHRWVTEGVVAGQTDGLPLLSYFEFERSWWRERARPNVLLVHFADLKADLGGEMRRIADFLGIAVAPDLWPGFVAAAGFGAMRRNGDTLLGSAATAFKEGGASFFHQGSNGRWRGLLREDDLGRYEAALSRLPPECSAWLGGNARPAPAIPPADAQVAMLPGGS